VCAGQGGPEDDTWESHDQFRPLHQAMLDFFAEHHRHPFLEEVPLYIRAFHASGR
jgi:hypothetical protein